MLLVRTFSGNDLLVDSPTTSPIIERPSLTPFDNQVSACDDLFSLPLSSEFSYFHEDSASCPPMSMPLPPPLEAVDDSYLPSFSLGVEAQAMFSYDPLPNFCSSSLIDDDGYAREFACVNPAALHAPVSSSMFPEIEAQEAQMLNFTFNFNPPQPQPQDVLDVQDVQDVCDPQPNEPITVTSRPKRSRSDDEYEDDACVAAVSDDEVASTGRPRKTVCLDESSSPAASEDDQEKLYPCTLCGRRFRRDAERVRHEFGHRPKAEQALTCTVCHRSVGGRRKDAMRRHQLRTALCIRIQERYTDEELKSMKCVTRGEREVWKARQKANKSS